MNEDSNSHCMAMAGENSSYDINAHIQDKFLRDTDQEMQLTVMRCTGSHGGIPLLTGIFPCERKLSPKHGFGTGKGPVRTVLTASETSQTENVPQSSHSVPGRAFSTDSTLSRRVNASTLSQGTSCSQTAPQVVNFLSLIFLLHFKRVIFDEKKKLKDNSCFLSCC